MTTLMRFYLADLRAFVTVTCLHGCIGKTELLRKCKC